MRSISFRPACSCWEWRCCSLASASGSAPGWSRARAGPGFVRNDKALAALGISPRECEVLELLAEGASNKVIARRLDISPNTVKTHAARLFEKLEAQSRTQAVRKARELDLLP
ncbi:MAG: response regulator transcription factor [Novosphingobium sp.]|nr:response regulator transcription factor [Novosphingobium sp.]